MRIALGPLHVTLKYTYPRGGTIIYQRPVPTKLRGRYPGLTIKHDLKTSDLVLAAKKVAKLNLRYEAEFAGLLVSPESSPVALRVHADALLKTFGLTPGSGDTSSIGADIFLDRLEDKLQRHAAGGDANTYENAAFADYLPPVELEAFKRLHGKHVPTLSDALNLHLDIHQQRDDTKFTDYQRRAFGTLLAVTGDKAMSALTREDARRYIQASLAAGSATGTVRRRMGAMRAVFTTWRLERDPSQINPFERLAIPNEGKDRKPRRSLTTADLDKLHKACLTKDDDMRWLLAMLIDTGARLAEITGLALADIILESDVPHIAIKVHPWRRLKNTGSVRVVPLVGASLWAAQRVVANATPGQAHAFPRYTGKTECRATAASGALKGWMQGNGIKHVPHELRHTMADRLRNVGCPKDIRYAIDGHAAQDVGDTYGSGHGLPILRDWLLKVALQE